MASNKAHAEDDVDAWDRANMEMFKSVANPQKTRFSSPRRDEAPAEGVPSPSNETERMEQLRTTARQVSGGAVSDGSLKSPSATTVAEDKDLSQSALSNTLKGDFERNDNEGLGDREDNRFRNLALTPPALSVDAPKSPKSPKSPRSPRSPKSPRSPRSPRSPKSQSGSHEDEARNAHDGGIDSADVQYEKQTVLLELEQLVKQHNVRLSKQYSLDDPLPDMQLEVRRHLVAIEEANTIKFMKDAMRVTCTGIEMFNQRLGPFLELEGWSGEVCQDMDRYNSAFSKLHKKYCKRASMSPEMELVVGIVGSIGMHHFRAKFLSPGQRGGAPHAGPAAHTSVSKSVAQHTPPKFAPPRGQSNPAQPPAAEGIPPSPYSRKAPDSSPPTPASPQRAVTIRRPPINFIKRDGRADSLL